MVGFYSKIFFIWPFGLVWPNYSHIVQSVHIQSLCDLIHRWVMCYAYNDWKGELVTVGISFEDILYSVPEIEEWDEINEFDEEEKKKEKKFLTDR